jgi:hypothetical protein
MTLTPDGLQQAMDTALGQVWQLYKGVPLPSEGAEDRKVLFLGIALGVLQYLNANTDFIQTIVLQNVSIGTTFNIQATDLNVNLNLKPPS